jgi:alpha-amylase
MPRLSLALAAVLLSCAPPEVPSAADSALQKRPVSHSALTAGAIIDLHGWHWQAIMDHMQEIRDAGYTAIQISPHTATCGGDFSDGYDPSDFTSFNCRFGTESDLYWLVKTTHAFGMQIYGDLVMNHMCAHADYLYPRFGWDAFHHNGTLSDYSNQWKVENQDLVGLNDLAQESDYVRGQLFDFVVKTNGMGFDGYRLDAAKHVPLWYWRDHVLNNLAAWGKYVYGEIVSGDPAYEQPYVDAGMAVTDYGLYSAINSAFHAYGDLSQLDGAGYAARNGPAALTFVENRDVGAPANRTLAYAFLSAYPGYPLFAGSLLGDPAIRNLVWVHVNLASGAYRGLFKSHDTLIFERQGHLVAAINQSGNWSGAWVQTSFPNTRLHDYAGQTGDVWTDGSGWVNVQVPPLGYAMLAP